MISPLIHFDMCSSFLEHIPNINLRCPILCKIFELEKLVKLEISLPRKSDASYTTRPAKCWIPNVRGSNGLGSKSRGFCLCWTLTLAIYDSAVPRMEHSTSSMLSRPVRCKPRLNSYTAVLSFNIICMCTFLWYLIVYITYQWRDEVNTGHIIHIIHFYLTVNTFISTWLNTRLENVRVVEMLHCLSTKVNAQMLQLTWLQHEDSVWVSDKICGLSETGVSYCCI